MNRTLLVSLLKKNIDELILITEGFMEMSEYPTAIINLAKNKTDDIRSYIDQLEKLKTTAVEPIIDLEEKTANEVFIANEILEEILEEINVEFLEETLETFSEEENPTEIEVTENEITVDDEEHNEQEVELKKTHTNEQEDEDEPKSFEETDSVVIEEETIVELIELTKETEDNVVSEPLVVAEVTTTTTETIEKKITIADKLTSQTITRNELHAKNENGGINASMANKKIEDIRQAISLGDRFRFQRELFRNNGEEMNKMLSYINMLASYDEVVTFLQSKYGWPENNPAAEDFYQIIKRKF
jgi:hypothetical protein